MKIGLVLEGGAMRGLFTAGVLDVFLDENIHVDGMVTVSAGALFGINFPSQQRGRVLRYNLKYLHDRRYMGLHSLLTTGNIVNREFAFYELPFALDPFDQKMFAQSGVDFWVTLTNVDTGEPEYVKITDAFAQMETLRATSAMPMVSKMVEVNGKRYLDGGISASIPVQQAMALGYDKMIVVLTRVLDYRKKPSSTLWFNLLYRKFPTLCKRWANRYAEYNEAVERVIELEQQGKIFVIRPSVDLNISRLEKNTAKIQAMYELGLSDAKQQMQALRDYLQA